MCSTPDFKGGPVAAYLFWPRRRSGQPPGPIAVKTLLDAADVRELLRHLPQDRRARPRWRNVVAELDKAAAGADTADVSIALRMALMIENVECR